MRKKNSEDSSPVVSLRPRALVSGAGASSPFLSIDEVAARLRNNVNWVREKVRRRCPRPIPVYNLGRHLVFDWAQVEDWVRNTPRTAHARHFRRKKKAVAA